MVEQMAIQLGMSLDEYLRRYDEEGRFEIIHGEVEPMSPNVIGHSYTVRFLFRALDKALIGSKDWEMYQETAFIRPDVNNPNWVKGALEPDVMLASKTDVDAYIAVTPDWKARPLPITPAFVIEVVSPTDRYPVVLRKVAQYLEYGVKLVWLVNPRRNTLSVYRAGNDEPDILGLDQTVTLDDLVPGFSLAVRDILQ